MIWPSITATFGRTPLVQLHRLCADTRARVVAKLESRNPCGSVKDRIGVALIEDAERRGVLKEGGTIVEPTSGNTGIALAFVAAARGYRLFLTMPETMSRERVALLRFLGAQVELTSGALMQAAVERAQAMLGEIPDAIMLNQFRNPANPEIHRRTTAVEIWDDTNGEVDVFVSGVGTGGTITGVGEVLKLRKPGVRVVAVEPAKCAVLSGRSPGNHLIQGIGAGFVPEILNRSVIDEVVAVTEDESFEYARRLAREEGIPAGISSGAAMAATLQLARRPGMDNKLFVVVLPDSGERYVTTPLMQELAGNR
jgi:cysteine synthase